MVVNYLAEKLGKILKRSAKMVTELKFFFKNKIDFYLIFQIPQIMRTEIILGFFLFRNAPLFLNFQPSLE